MGTQVGAEWGTTREGIESKWEWGVLGGGWVGAEWGLGGGWVGAEWGLGGG